VERNVFGLKPPPPAPGPDDNKPPAPKIFLTGITTILGTKVALMKLTPPPAKPGEPAKEESFTLKVGQRQSELEALEIDEKAGTVKVNEYGTITTLSFESNGVKTASAPAAPGPAPHPGVGGAPPPAGGAPAFPTGRPARMALPGAPSAPPGAYGGAPAPSAYNAAPAASSYGSLPVGATPTQTAAQQQEPSLSGEAQLAVMAAQHLQNQDKIFPPPLPPVAQMLAEPGSSESTPAAATPERRGPPLPPGGARTPPPAPPQMPQ